VGNSLLQTAIVDRRKPSRERIQRGQWLRRSLIRLNRYEWRPPRTAAGLRPVRWTDNASDFLTKRLEAEETSCCAMSYPKGIKVSDELMATINIKGDPFHLEWNYSISPRSPT
jgi:hypothetical protein